MTDLISEKAFHCERCGKCCLTVPCVFAQVKYGITKSSGKVCPDLKKNGAGYICLMVDRDPEARKRLITGYCDHPSKVHLKPTFSAVEVVKQVFPDATDDECEFILWEKTGYPAFWNIPKDGWTAKECLETQLRRLKC